ncbi:30S ribosomal protein S2 [Candidatus Woesearchaeota archaeon]|nr:30S ribosomal protein S2 [Candidatus Woesearchaeota archaeon]
MMKMTEDMLVTNEDYLKSGVHIGTKFRTKYMSNFIYKTRSDGLSILNIQKIDERIGIAAKFLANYAPEDILIVSRRENGWHAVSLMEKLAGVQVLIGRYPPGILTNPNLKSYREAKVLVVTDAWPDRNAVDDALKVGVPVVALCDTNNQPNNIDLVLPCNNKGKKSLGVVFYLLTKHYMYARGLLNKGQDLEVSLDEFMGE